MNDLNNESIIRSILSSNVFIYQQINFLFAFPLLPLSKETLSVETQANHFALKHL